MSMHVMRSVNLYTCIYSEIKVTIANLCVQGSMYMVYIYHLTIIYGVHLRTKIIENKRHFEVQKLDYPCRNLVI